MKERYRNELSLFEKLLGVWRVNKDSFDTKWGYFAPRFGLELMLHRGGYFHQQYAISFCFIWGKFHIRLPFKTKLGEGCDMPRYGFYVSDETLSMYWGGKYDASMGQMARARSKHIDLPFVSYVFEDWWVYTRDDQWTSTQCLTINAYELREQQGKTETYDYSYVLKSGEIQHRKATVCMERRQWHRKWLPWIKLRKQSIDIMFDKEVGERSGSWKGGVMGCGYGMLPAETMEQTLRRMESERVFN